MALLPDWNSIESTTRWSEGLFWAGIVALALVAVTELAAHVYGSRAASLLSSYARIDAETQQRKERQTEQRQSAEMANIQQKLNSADAELKNLKSNNARHLFDSQTRELVKSLAPFAGQKIKVWCSDTASDSAPLGREFVAVLKRAGWVVPDAIMTGPIAGGETEGIHVVYEGDLTSPSQIPRGIDTLISNLERFGLISSDTLYLDPATHGGGYLLKIGRTPATN